MSQIDKYIEKYDLRPGMGLSLVQIGIPKRIFVISEELDKGEFKRYIVINPKIIAFGIVFSGFFTSLPRGMTNSIPINCHKAKATDCITVDQPNGLNTGTTDAETHRNECCNNKGWTN